MATSRAQAQRIIELLDQIAACDRHIANLSNDKPRGRVGITATYSDSGGYSTCEAVLSTERGKTMSGLLRRFISIDRDNAVRELVRLGGTLPSA